MAKPLRHTLHPSSPSTHHSNIILDQNPLARTQLLASDAPLLLPAVPAHPPGTPDNVPTHNIAMPRPTFLSLRLAVKLSPPPQVRLSSRIPSI